MRSAPNVNPSPPAGTKSANTRYEPGANGGVFTVHTPSAVAYRVQVGVAGEIAADDHQVQLLVVLDRVVGDRTTVRAFDHELQVGAIGRFDDRGTQVERVAVRAHRQAGRPVARRGDSVGVAVGADVARRSSPVEGSGPTVAPTTSPPARANPSTTENAPSLTAGDPSVRPSFMTMTIYH